MKVVFYEWEGKFGTENRLSDFEMSVVPHKGNTVLVEGNFFKVVHVSFYINNFVQDCSVF
jgi:hypothetical protein